MRVLIAVALTLAVACFEPTEPDGALRCSPGSACPDGFECRADLLCWRPGTGPDAAQPVDGLPDVPPPVPACDNGIDDDCDGKIDREDHGCMDDKDDDERGRKKCDDGIDNDGDGAIDFSVAACSGTTGDPDCDMPDDDSESSGPPPPG